MTTQNDGSDPVDKVRSLIWDARIACNDAMRRTSDYDLQFMLSDAHDALEDHGGRIYQYLKDNETSLKLPRCGDHVLHRPTGETWFVAFADGDDLAAAGWPSTIDRVSDCEVTYRCTNTEHHAAVEGWRHTRGDNRAARVLRLYGGTSDAE